MTDNNILEPYEAVSLAYERDLKPHLLPWALQKLTRPSRHDDGAQTYEKGRRFCLE